MSRYLKKDDSDLIWESMINRTRHKQNSDLQKLWEHDVKYVEQFLIDEGLMDKVKGAYKGAKEFASSKLLQPVMKFLAGIIMKDPGIAQKAQAAAAKGPEAMQQLASAEGDQSVMNQIQQAPVQAAESYITRLKMNEFICEALVEDGIITVNESSLILEKHISSAVHSLVNEHKKNQEIPWRPIVEKGGQDFAAQVNSLLQSTGTQPKKAINAMIADEGLIGTHMYNFLRKVGVDPAKIDSLADSIRRRQEPASPQQEPAPEAGGEAPAPEAGGEAPAPGAGGEAPAPGAGGEAPAPGGGGEAPAPGGGGETPAPEAGGETPAPVDGGTVPGLQDPDAPSGAAGATPPEQSQAPGGPSEQPTGPNPPQPTGLLGKIWQFIKSNKGMISGAAALGIAAALTASGNPMAASYLTGALIGGVRGAIKGATGTEGGFVDKLKGAANQAGKDSMIGGGIGAAAAGVGGMVSDLGVGGDVAANADAASPAAEPTVGGDEFSEPTRPDADELAQMQADTGMQDPEANANAGLPDPYDPANSEAPTDPEANANAGLPDPYDPANSEAPMQEPTRPDAGTTRGINPDGSEYTKDADGNAVDGQQATDKKGFGQKFKDFFKASETPRKLPTRVSQGRAF